MFKVKVNGDDYRVRFIRPEIARDKTKCTICFITDNEDTVVGQGESHRNPLDIYDKGVGQRLALMDAVRYMLQTPNLHNPSDAPIANKFLEAHNTWITTNGVKTSIRLDSLIKV